MFVRDTTLQCFFHVLGRNGGNISPIFFFTGISHFLEAILIPTMGVPSIEAEEAADSSLLTCVPIALLPGRLPFSVIDCICDSKSRMRSMKAERETSGNEAMEVVD